LSMIAPGVGRPVGFDQKLHWVWIICFARGMLATRGAENGVPFSLTKP